MSSAVALRKAQDGHQALVVTDVPASSDLNSRSMTPLVNSAGIRDRERCLF